MEKFIIAIALPLFIWFLINRFSKKNTGDIIKHKDDAQVPMKIQTLEGVSYLQPVNDLKDICKKLSLIEAIICEEWQDRYYSYDKSWNKDGKEECFIMRDGCGDEFLIVFRENTAIINGFAHESQISQFKLENNQKVWKGILNDIPTNVLNTISIEPFLSIGTTFLLWNNGTKWETNSYMIPDDGFGDGRDDLLSVFNNPSQAYTKFALDYYELEADSFNSNNVSHFLGLNTLSKEDVLQIDPDFEDWARLIDEVEKVGLSHQL